MRFTLILSLLIFGNSLVFAEQTRPFEIPRSHVVELLDPVSERTYPLFIKLPKSYTKNPDQYYPVIYLTDAWYSFQIVSGATRYPMNVGKMQEAIIVGISYSKGSRGSSSRVRDYTPATDKSWKLTTGGAKLHAQFIEQTVFSYIESHYRADKTKRTFVGNSLGGLFGAYMLFNKPAMFQNYVLGSPSVWFKDEMILEETVLDETALYETLKLGSKPVRVFIAVGANETPELGPGQHDMVRGAEQLAAKIRADKSANLELKLLFIDQANHETAFPTTAIQGLYWLLNDE